MKALPYAQGWDELDNEIKAQGIDPEVCSYGIRMSYGNGTNIVVAYFHKKPIAERCIAGEVFDDEDENS